MELELVDSTENEAKVPRKKAKRSTLTSILDEIKALEVKRKEESDKIDIKIKALRSRYNDLLLAEINSLGLAELLTNPESSLKVAAAINDIKKAE